MTGEAFLYTLGINLITFLLISFGMLFISRKLKFKRRTFIYAFLIGIICTFMSFISSFLTIIMDISPVVLFKYLIIQLVIFMVILIICIKIIYKIEWGQAVISFLILVGILLIIGTFITLIIFYLFIQPHLGDSANLYSNYLK